MFVVFFLMPYKEYALCLKNSYFIYEFFNLQKLSHIGNTNNYHLGKSDSIFRMRPTVTLFRWTVASDFALVPVSLAFLLTT